MLLASLWGCGGGGLNLPNVVNSPNPPTGYRVAVRLNMDQVYEGEEVTCTAQLSPSSVQAEVRWRQEPSSPTGRFSPLSGAVVRWHAPLVEKATSFSLIACVVIQGKSYEGSASVIVLDKSEPPQEPPRISISYPLDDGKQNLVGEGTLLTIIGNVQAGSNPIQKIQILEGSNVLQEWPIAQGDFRVDLSNFGVPGRKVLKVRVVDSAGLYSETSIPVINDDTELEAQARQFLKKYSCSGDGGTVRFGNLQTGPYAQKVRIYINSVQQWKDLIEKACSFWTQYTGIQFEVTTFTGSAEFPSIVIADYTNVDKPIVAETIRGYITDPHEIDATVRLYKGWLDESNDQRIRTLAHEIGHGLYTEKEVTEFGPYFVQWPYGPLEIQKVIIPPIVQEGIKMLYSHSPGWAP
jgi:hypothetical protein